MINERTFDVGPDLVAADLPSAAGDYLAFVRTGDAQALDRALHASVKQAYTQAYRRLGNAADADDAVQEAFLQLVRRAVHFDGSIPFHVWLALMVKTACMRLLRSDRRRRVREGMTMSPVEQSPAADHPLNEHLRAKIALLSPADSTLIELHYFAGLSQAEVAAAVGSSENAVALRLSRARNHLRKLFGGKITAAGVVTLLATQQSYAASPHALTGIASLAKSVALGQALPAHVIPLTFTEKALMFMSLNPISTCACAVVLLVGGLTPIFLPAAEAQPPVPVATTTPPTPPSATASSKGKPWAGKAKELLPFMNPQALVSVAIDWEYLRQVAPNTALTSAFSDERSRNALAHIAKQLEYYAQGDNAMPDWFKLLTGLDAAVVEFNGNPVVDSIDFFSALSASDAKQMIKFSNAELGISQDEAPRKIGPYDVWKGDRGNAVFAQSAGHFFLSHTNRLQAGLARKDVTPPSAPIHVFVDGKKAVSVLAQLTDKYGDVFGLDAMLGSQWRHSQPTISIDGMAKDGLWQTSARIRGNFPFPLRAASPSIAGCLTPGNMASLVLGCDMKQALAWAKLVLGEKETQGMITSLHVDEATLVQCLTGDIACMVRQGPTFPEGTLVLGLHDQTADRLAKKLGSFFTQAGLTPAGSDVTRWEGVTPVGKLTLQFSNNRLVIQVGNDEPKLAQGNPTATDALAIDIDLRAWSRSYLPLLMNLVPPQTKEVPLTGPLSRVLHEIMIAFWTSHERPIKVKQLDDLLRDREFHYSLAGSWKRMTDGESSKSIQRNIAVFIAKDQESNEKSVEECQFVFRTTTGWRIIKKNIYWDMSSSDYGKLADVQAALRGSRQVGGVAVADLGVINLPEQAYFDRRWLPPLDALVDHMPIYRLRAQATDDGYVVVEDGVPIGIIAGVMAAAPLVATPAVVSRQDIRKDGQIHMGDLQKAFMEALIEKHKDDLVAKYQPAINAFRQFTDRETNRQMWEPLLLTPSSAFAAVGVPLTALAVFTDQVPPTPAQVDAIGFWDPRNGYSWTVPIEHDLFIEFGWGPDRFMITAVPLSEPRKLTAEELKQISKINEERLKSKTIKNFKRKPSSPEEKTKPEDFNSF